MFFSLFCWACVCIGKQNKNKTKETIFLNLFYLAVFDVFVVRFVFFVVSAVAVSEQESQFLGLKFLLFI